jgi:hypothetical protein
MDVEACKKRPTALNFAIPATVMLTLETATLDKDQLRSLAEHRNTALVATDPGDLVDFQWMPDGSLLLTVEMSGDMVLGAIRLVLGRHIADAFLDRLVNFTPSPEPRDSCECLGCASN